MYIFYSKPEFNNRCTIVGEHSDGKLKISVARCSKKDHFCKKMGRRIAEGRLNKNVLYAEVSMKTCNISDFIDIAKSIDDVIRNNASTINLMKAKEINS